MLQPPSFLFTRAPSPSSSSSKSSRSRESKHERPEGKTRPLAKRDTRDMSPTITTTPSTTSTESSRPTTPSSPVVIPLRGQHDPAHDRKRSQRVHEKRESGRSERRSRNIHSHDAIPPSVAALLALTSIPPKKSGTVRRRSGAGQRLTADAILRHTGASEMEFGMSLGRSPLDLLLSPPDEEDETPDSETGRESVLSIRTMSSESMPSLDDDASLSEASPSFSSLVTTASSGTRGRRNTPPRRRQSLALPVLASSDSHPLSEVDVDELDFRVFQHPSEKEEEKSRVGLAVPRRKSAFKSNLTASLKALRSAARSISNLTTPMITPDDFLTRSIVSIDPRVPFTDERMPPRLEDTPTAALRRYLNPTTNAPIEAHVATSHTQTLNSTTCTASIQMQTYKVSRSSKGSSPIVISRRTQPTPEDVAEVATGPLGRQRDMRENSDFIRVAVMEKIMRERGKLDEQKPGRARWALPPRKPPTKPYEISGNGVPIRWIAVTI